MNPWHLLGLVGATIIIARGSIFARLREVYPPLLSCTLCCGWWVGVIGAAVLQHGAHGYDNVADFFLDGCSVSLLSLAVDAVLMKLLGDPDHQGG